MKFGHFDDAKREYVIETPETPKPWINYLGSEGFYGIISNTAGGYSFYKDAKMRRLTRYRYNNVPLDCGGRYFYLSDGKEYWSPTWQPVRADLDHYSCRHGLGYTIIESVKNKIKSEILYFIPPGGDTIEIHRVRLENQGKSAVRLKLFSLIEFCLWNADEDDRNFQRNLSIGEVEVESSFIFHKTEYRERRNHYAYYAVNGPINSFETDRESFVGTYNGYDEPKAVLEGRCSNSRASGWSPIASHCLDVSIPAGKSREYIFGLGYIELPEKEKFSKPGVINKRPAFAQFKKYSTTAAVEKAFDALKKSWDGLLSPYQMECDDDRLSRMVNIWNPYQCMTTFNMSRSASYFESGIGRGMGFRDSNQDLLGFVHQAPERSRERILDLAATQLASGGAYHQYQPLTKRGNADIGGNFNDDPLWLILGVGAYIRETGDFSILKDKVPFDNDPKQAASLLEHLFRSYKFTLANLGPHKLPLIGRADWNDCLNLNCFSDVPGQSFQTTANREGRTAESIMIAGLFIFACEEFACLLDSLGRPESAEVRASAKTMSATIDKHGRDAAWFLRAYDFFGSKVGSSSCKDGKIYIESQGWCVMAGLGRDDGFAKKALDSVAKHLSTPHGIVLQWPAYKDYHLELGEVSSYPPGYKENGGIFCHTNPWIMIAEAMMGNSERAFDYYKRICPAYRESISETHKMEPYVYSQMIGGKEAPRPGEAKNSWLTGTAAWNYVAITQYILGVRAGYSGLVVKPCLPRDFKRLKVSRKFRGCLYEIEMRRCAKAEKPGLAVNGKPFQGDEIPPSGKKAKVVCLF